MSKASIPPVIANGISVKTSAACLSELKVMKSSRKMRKNVAGTTIISYLAMNNLLAGQQATRRRASKAGTEKDNINPLNSTHKNKEEAPAADWF